RAQGDHHGARVPPRRAPVARPRRLPLTPPGPRVQAGPHGARPCLSRPRLPRHGAHLPASRDCAGASRRAPAPTESTMPTTAAAPATPASADNPLLVDSTLAFQAPRFDLIQDAHYQPAIEEGMRRHLAEVRAIADSAEAPTFANTIEALERSGRLLTRAASVFFAMTSAHTNPVLQAAEEALAPELAAHADAIHLDPKLFARVKALHAQRARLGLSDEQRTVLEHTFDRFVRAGAELDAD